MAEVPPAGSGPPYRRPRASGVTLRIPRSGASSELPDAPTQQFRARQLPIGPLAAARSAGEHRVRVGALPSRHTKFLVPEERLAELLEDHEDRYQLLYHGNSALSTFSTLYFDTPDLQCFSDDEADRRPRYRVRFRQRIERPRCFLEIVGKSESQSSRYQMRTDGPRMQLSDGDRQFVRTCCDLDPALLHPVLRIDHRRLTLVRRDRPEKVVIDMCIAYEHLGGRFSLPGVVVADVRQPQGAGPSDLAQSIIDVGGVARTFSKYRTGHTLCDERLFGAHRIRERLRSTDRAEQTERWGRGSQRWAV